VTRAAATIRIVAAVIDDGRGNVRVVRKHRVCLAALSEGHILPAARTLFATR